MFVVENLRTLILKSIFVILNISLYACSDTRGDAPVLQGKRSAWPGCCATTQVVLVWRQCPAQLLPVPMPSDAATCPSSQASPQHGPAAKSHPCPCLTADNPSLLLPGFIDVVLPLEGINPYLLGLFQLLSC